MGAVSCARNGFLILLFAIAAPQTRGAEDKPAADAIPFKHKLILEELNGGTDSAVSPDGEWLAFSTRRSGNLDIWITHIETGRTRQITSHPATDNEARWSPDGKQLCFVTQRSGSQDIYVVDLETGKETPIATQPHNEDYPSYSQDGSEIVYTGGPRGYREVQVYNFAKGEIRTVTRGFGYVGSANFSPDGKQIVFHAYYDNNYNSGKSDVYVVPAQGGKAVNVTNERTVWNYKPCWSFCGNWITYSSKRSTPNFNLWAIRPDGTDRRALTNVTGPDLRWSNWTKDGRIGWHQVNPQNGRIRAVEIATGKVIDLHTSDFHMRDLSASPDGRYLMYETDWDIYILEAKPEAKPRPFTSGLSPRWSRDGRSITYLLERRTKIGVMAADGGEERVIDARPAVWPEATTNGWSPDGQSLAVIAAEGERNALVVISANGTSRNLVDNTELKSSPTWSPDGQYVFFAENHPATVGYYVSGESVIDPHRRAMLPENPGRRVAENSAAAKPGLAPDFTLKNLDGQSVTISKTDASVTLLYFWSTSRECESDLRALDRLRDQYAGRGVAILGLCFSSGTPEQVRRFLDSNGVELPTLMCTKRVCDDFGVSIFPTTVVVDRDRRIHHWKYGVQIEEHWQGLLDEMVGTE